MGTETKKLEWVVLPCDECPGNWTACAVDLANEGVMYHAEFSGPNAEIFAREYAAIKNGNILRERDEARALLAEIGERLETPRHTRRCRWFNGDDCNCVFGRLSAYVKSTKGN